MKKQFSRNSGSFSSSFNEGSPESSPTRVGTAGGFGSASFSSSFGDGGFGFGGPRSLSRGSNTRGGTALGGERRRLASRQAKVVEEKEEEIIEDALESKHNPLIGMIKAIDNINIKVETDVEHLVNENNFYARAVDPTTRDTATHVACSRIHFLSSSLICFFIDTCPGNLSKPNRFGMLPLHKAVMAKPKFISTRKRLVERLEDDDPQTRCGINIDSIYMLIEANPMALTATNIEGQTPLHLCLNNQNHWTEEIVAALLDDDIGRQALTMRDAYGSIPLHCAAANRLTTTATLVQILDANPNGCMAQDKKGQVNEQLVCNVL
jgi:hypothetical protein